MRTNLSLAVIAAAALSVAAAAQSQQTRVLATKSVYQERVATSSRQIGVQPPFHRDGIRIESRRIGTAPPLGKGRVGAGGEAGSLGTAPPLRGGLIGAGGKAGGLGTAPPLRGGLIGAGGKAGGLSTAPPLRGGLIGAGGKAGGLGTAPPLGKQPVGAGSEAGRIGTAPPLRGPGAALGETGSAAIGTQPQNPPPSPSYSVYGGGCAGSNGVPTLRRQPGSMPCLGRNFRVDVLDLPLNPGKPAFGLLGAAPQHPPLDLGPLGMPSCLLYVSDPVVMPLAKAAGTAVWTLPIPPDPRLVGAEFFQQVLALDEASVNLAGAVVSNWARGIVGAEL